MKSADYAIDVIYTGRFAAHLRVLTMPAWPEPVKTTSPFSFTFMTIA
jgi:hypothetical protein